MRVATEVVAADRRELVEEWRCASAAILCAVRERVRERFARNVRLLKLPCVGRS